MDPVEEKLPQYKQNWSNRVKSVKSLGYQEQLPDYRQAARGNAWTAVNY
jgi:hypothetical protein